MQDRTNTLLSFGTMNRFEQTPLNRSSKGTEQLLYWWRKGLGHSANLTVRQILNDLKEGSSEGDRVVNSQEWRHPSHFRVNRALGETWLALWAKCYTEGRAELKLGSESQGWALECFVFWGGRSFYFSVGEGLFLLWYFIHLPSAWPNRRLPSKDIYVRCFFLHEASAD